MCFCAARPKDLNWFSACITGNISFVQSKIEKFKGVRDSRESNEQDNVFTGFAGIHYASYIGNVGVLQALLPQEYNILTSETVTLLMTGITNGSCRYKLSKGSTPLMVAIVRGKLDCARVILKFCAQMGEKVTSALLGVRNETGITALSLACVDNVPNIVQLLYQESKLLLRKELTLTCESGMSCLLYAAFFGRFYTVDSICKSLFDAASDDREEKLLKVTFAHVLLLRDSAGNSCLDSATDEIDYDKYGTSKGNKRSCYLLLKPYIKRVVEWALRDDPDYAGLFDQRSGKTLSTQLAGDPMRQQYMAAGLADMGMSYRELCMDLKIRPDEDFLAECRKWAQSIELNDQLMTDMSTVTLETSDNNSASDGTAQTRRDAYSVNITFDANGMMIVHGEGESTDMALHRDDLVARGADAPDDQAASQVDTHNEEDLDAALDAEPQPEEEPAAGPDPGPGLGLGPEPEPEPEPSAKTIEAAASGSTQPGSRLARPQPAEPSDVSEISEIQQLEPASREYGATDTQTEGAPEEHNILDDPVEERAVPASPAAVTPTLGIPEEPEHNSIHNYDNYDPYAGPASPAEEKDPAGPAEDRGAPAVSAISPTDDAQDEPRTVEAIAGAPPKVSDIAMTDDSPDAHHTTVAAAEAEAPSDENIFGAADPVYENPFGADPQVAEQPAVHVDYNDNNPDTFKF